MKRSWLAWGMIGMLVLGSGYEIQAQEESALGQEELLFMEIPVVVTASMQEQEINRVPGTMTIITDEQIKQYGFLTLMDVIETIPGFQMKQQPYGSIDPIVRNYSWGSAHVKLMIDGYPVHNTNSTTEQYHRYPLDNVKQIEIIRGPGSALYGTNAFTAVINIITNKEERSTASVSGGEFYNYGGNVAHYSDPEKDFSYSVTIDYEKERGDELYYETDWLTGINNAITGEKLSYAPCTREKGKERLGGGVSLRYKDLSININHADFEQDWTEGFVNIMSPGREWVKYRFTYAEVQYSAEISDKSNLLLKAGYDRTYIQYAGELFPEDFAWAGPLPGIPAPIFGQTFFDGTYYWSWEDEGTAGYYLDTNGDGLAEYWPDGVNRDPGSELNAEHYSADVIYRTEIKNHKLSYGLQFGYEEIGEVSSTANVSSMDLSRKPYGKVTGQDPENWNHGQGETETQWAVYGQDIYDLHERLSIVAGARYDYYSDAGSAFAPRMAIVWNAFHDQILKLSYGRAFMAPYPGVKYIRSFGYNGNPDLEPQTIQTFEVALQNPFEKKLHYAVVMFYSRVDNGFAMDMNRDPVYWNTDEYTFIGGEIEGRWTLLDRLTLWGNYSYSKPESEENVITSTIAGAKHVGNAGFNLGVIRDLDLNSFIHIEGKKERHTADPHTSLLDGFTRIHAALSYSGIPHTTLSVVARNLLDEKYYSQNYQESRLGEACSDFPHEGRQVIVKGEVKF